MSDRDKADRAELERYGIERVPADIYLWSGDRYSTVRDEMTAAKRNAKP